MLAQRPRVDRGFERIYRRHVRDVYHYALAVLHNPADAEDVTQTTFLNALRAYDRGERPRAPQNWLIAIAHNVCRQRFRQSLRRPHEVAFDDDLADRVVDDDVPSAQDIRQALSQLAFNQRAALVMRELEGRTYAEIATILGLSVGAVETLLFRARRALREQLEGTLTCQQAELAISKQLDGRLARPEKGPLRAHLRACPDCASVARRQRAQRAAFKALAAVPLPSSLASLFGGGGAAVGTGVAAKAAAVLATGALVGGVGYEGARHTGLMEHGAKARGAAAVGPALRTSGPAVAGEATTLRRNPVAREHRVLAPQARGVNDSRSKHSRAKVRVRTRGAGASVHPVHPARPTRPAKPFRRAGRARPAHLEHPVHPVRGVGNANGAAKTPRGQAKPKPGLPPTPQGTSPQN